MKPATEILLSAAFVLTPEENWTKHALARNEDGDTRHYSCVDAVSWCVVGAVCAVANGTPGENALQFLDEVCGMNRVDFNNTHTHAEVLAKLYEAAELSEAS